jgi:hypothetical protein
MFEINESFYKATKEIEPIAIPTQTNVNEAREAVEEQVMGAILKATGPKESKAFIKKTLGASV